MKNITDIGEANISSDQTSVQPAVPLPVVEESERLQVYRSWANLPARIQQAIVLLVLNYGEEAE